MTKLLPCIGAALLALAVLARKDAPARPVERRIPAAVEAPAPEIWTDLDAIPEAKGHNDLQEALASTAEQLSLEGARDVDFRRLATRAVEDIRRAWELRESALGAGESQAVYEKAKEKAMEPLMCFLLGAAPDVFLAKVDEMVDSWVHFRGSGT